ncbi:MAG: ECF-type sigma factor [Planctomycetota bacterium]
MLLDQVADGDRKAADELFALVYSELRALAGGKMKGESSDHTLQSTALVHEVWLKLVGSQQSPEWKNRGHFFAAASQAMRRILVGGA